MHWVWATDANTNQRIPVNLAAIPTMMRATLPVQRQITILFLGGIARVDGRDYYAQTHVLESPEELLIAPVIVPPAFPKFTPQKGST